MMTSLKSEGCGGVDDNLLPCKYCQETNVINRTIPNKKKKILY